MVLLGFFACFLSCNLKMLTHWHGVPTQMLLLESTTGRAWRDTTPPWRRLQVGLFGDSRFLFWWFAWSLTSWQVSPKVCSNSGRCQVEQLLWWKFHVNINLTNSAKFYHPWQDFQDFQPSHTFSPLKSCPTGILNAQSYCQLLSAINTWHVSFRSYFGDEANRMDYHKHVLVSLNSIPAHTHIFFLPGKTSWGVHAMLDASWGFCTIRAFILNIV